VRFLGLLAFLGAFGGALGGCLGSSSQTGTSTATYPTSVPVTAGRLSCSPGSRLPPCTPGVRLGAPQPYVLLTHCGIRDAYFDGRLWVADPMLSDGSDNPPPGWGNPAQAGTMELVSRSHAVFRAGRLAASFKPAPRDYRSELCQ
jgi:hypothetical protein